MSFLEIEGYHVFVTGAAGGIGGAIVAEFLAQGCKVTAHDLKPSSLPSDKNLFTVQGDISDEASIESCMTQAREHFGPIHILAANAGITDEDHDYPLWQMPVDVWEKTYHVNIRGTFLTIKHFLRSAELSQKDAGKELDNLSIVLTGSETGKFGQAGHAEYASGKSGLQYGLIRSVKNEIVRLNQKARINAVAPGWCDTPLIEGRLDDPKEMYAETQATVALKKIAQPTDVARAFAFLASHRAAGHISGECLSVDGGMEGRIVWRESEVLGARGQEAGATATSSSKSLTSTSIPQHISSSSKLAPKIKIALSVDFDAVSGWLGTGYHPDNVLADYSAGFFAAQVGVPRLLKMFKKHGISDKITWAIPGHSMETFPEQTKAILDSGCEVALHGYAHEGAPQMTEEQERDVLVKCIELVTSLTGKKPKGYRAPLYQLRESTINLLEEHGFLYDSSLAHHDSTPYYLPHHPTPIVPIDFSPSAKAADWMHPTPAFTSSPLSKVVEIPCNWYMEDMTPLQFYPHTANSQGYVDVRVIERMWQDRFHWLVGEIEDGRQDMVVFPLVMHPDTSGMSHVIGMIERFIGWVKGWGDKVEFLTYAEIAEQWAEQEK
ncbi:polysaccharide deacetylase family protein-like protein [Cryomyces antarcticus]|uniref:NodB homology domain-containing protein n=1 Tax=Cryomyces antarcticus TaxID=329879 RepID=A0ABR0M8L0_9PEZI|nr:hypothetical protein LTR39_000525 [Cryomyces antarcticus]KAK5020085.1 hypothetical protein LTR60_000850 [Cryomyces antarcticus]KAK5153264.1 hypothetical protein LTR04_006252 [Oleoguttula sp. CCFEE 6159]KAK5295712.1 hypothetical protein LTR16_000773 [Cryomyces antarcticus]